MISKKLFIYVFVFNVTFYYTVYRSVINVGRRCLLIRSSMDIQDNQKGKGTRWRLVRWWVLTQECGLRSGGCRRSVGVEFENTWFPAPPLSDCLPALGGNGELFVGHTLPHCTVARRCAPILLLEKRSLELLVGELHHRTGMSCFQRDGDVVSCLWHTWAIGHN